MSYIDLATNAETPLSSIRERYPFSQIPEGADLGEFGYATAIELPMPELPEGHKLVRGEPALTDGAWSIGWTVVPLTELELETARLMRVPQRINRRQGRLALRNRGLLTVVESGIAAIEDEDERMDAQIEYEADTWELANPFLQATWAKLGGTERELQDLFVVAATL